MRRQAASLVDHDGKWIIGEQGAHQADGDWPEFSDVQWVSTNGITATAARASR
ncbi:MAG: DUF4087 domain-containing protein [Lysobacteraceae bacterium]